jgi:hypothetical protein
VDKRDGSIRLFLALCCWAASAYSLIALSVLPWVLRDGLGPEMVASHGWVAIQRYFKGVGWSLLIPAAFLISGFLLYRSDLRRNT